MSVATAPISDDARVVAARLFGLSKVGADVSMYTHGQRPSHRCRNALAELEAAQIIRARPGPDGTRERVYTPLKDCAVHVKWLRTQQHNQDVDFQLVERGL